MYRSSRLLGVVLVGVLAVTLSLPLSASGGAATAATAAAPSAARAAGTTAHRAPTFTKKEARDVLGRVQRAFDKRAGSVPPNGSRLGRRAKLPRTDLTMQLRDLALARTSLGAADRRSADRLLARPTNGAGDDPRSVKYGRATWRYHCFDGTMFCVHWVTNGPNRISLTDRNHDHIPDYVRSVATTMDSVFKYETGTMGYRKPIKDTDTAGIYRGNPNQKYDVYLAELGSMGLYGYCAPEWRGHGVPPLTQAAYCVLDNNYSPRQYGSSSYLDPLRVTAAHEFFHSVQFAYDVAEDSWFTEGTATWMEDEVYDSINDNLQYLAASPIRYPRSAVDYQTDIHRYGAWIFFRYASEFLHTRDVVREMWEAAAANAPGNPISMQAIRSAVSARHSWQDFYVHFGLWNLLTTTPDTSYSERNAYPPPVYRLSKHLTSTDRDGGLIRTPLLHTASAAFRAGTDSSLPTDQLLNVSVRAPKNPARGSVAVVQTRYRDGTLGNVNLTLDADGFVFTQVPFDPDSITSVVVLVSNTSTAMNHCGTITGSDGYDKYSCGGRGTYDYDSDFLVHLKLAASSS